MNALNIILIGHHQIAVSMKNAVEMIFGKVDEFYPITFLPQEGLQELTNKLEKVLQTVDEKKETLVIADLFSGTLIMQLLHYIYNIELQTLLQECPCHFVLKLQVKKRR